MRERSRSGDAISGRFVATASRTAPPSASPSPSRVSTTSVDPESWIPASHTAMAATRKIRTSGTNPRPENTNRFYRNDRPARTRRRQRGSPAGTSTSCPLGERLGDASAPTGRSRAVARLGDATERAMLAYDRRRPRRCGANIAAAPPGGYPRSTLPSAPARVVGWRPLRVRCRRACGRGRRTGRCGRSARGSRRVARVVA